VALLEAVKTNRYKDKTECITEALNKLLCNTEQDPQDNTAVIQEKDSEIQNLQSELRSKYAVIQKLQSELQNYKSVIQNHEIEILRLQSVLRDSPDPLEHAKLQERNEGLNLLLEEKNRRIEELTQYKEDLGAFANYFKSLPPKLIEAPEVKKPWWKIW
jgi:chromosome segregation ATPase